MKPAVLMNKQQIEAIAERILLDYGIDPNGKRIQSIPVEEIVEFHFDLHIRWETIDHFDAEGVVMAAIIPSEKEIIMNETQRGLFESKLGTYYFTLAHELGHWVLHAGGSEYHLRNAPYYCRAMSRKPTEELEADYFAGCLLMPRAMLERAIGQLLRMGGVRWHHLYNLAQCLQVSISALTVRLEQLKLLQIDKSGQVIRPGKPVRPLYEQLTLDI